MTLAELKQELFYALAHPGIQESYDIEALKMYSDTLINRLFGRPTYQITVSDETSTHEFFF